jgi:orotidine-5'-phosphate decarboxylase
VEQYKSRAIAGHENKNEMVEETVFNVMAQKVMVALDYPTAAEAERLLDQLMGIPCWMKVGMQLFYAAGPQFIKELKQRGYLVFVDLKLHDIPNTVRGGAASLTQLGADMFNVHASGGMAMMIAAAAGAASASANAADESVSVSGKTNDVNKHRVTNGVGAYEAANEGITTNAGKMDIAQKTGPLLIAVTQLTSTDQAILNDEIGIAGSVEESVRRYAWMAKQAGLHGVVASAAEVKLIKETCGAPFITVTPGIRPIGTSAGDQARVLTPKEAILEGTDYLVIGRPITGSADPRQSLERIIQSMM